MNFAIPPKNVNHADFYGNYYLLNFCLGILIHVRFNFISKFIRSRLRDRAFTSFRDSSKISENNLSKEEHLALKDLIKSKDLVIQRADKGNTLVILNKNNYISKMKVILSDSSKFQKLSTN